MIRPLRVSHKKLDERQQNLQQPTVKERFPLAAAFAHTQANTAEAYAHSKHSKKCYAHRDKPVITIDTTLMFSFFMQQVGSARPTAQVQSPRDPPLKETAITPPAVSIRATLKSVNSEDWHPLTRSLVSSFMISFLLSGISGFGHNAHDKKENRAHKSVGNDKGKTRIK
jgi:hypothetical protein